MADEYEATARELGASGAVRFNKDGVQAVAAALRAAADAGAAGQRARDVEALCPHCAAGRSALREPGPLGVWRHSRATGDVCRAHRLHDAGQPKGRS